MRAGGRDQALAEAFWETGIHDARILASLIDDPDKITGRFRVLGYLRCMLLRSV